MIRIKCIGAKIESEGGLNCSKSQSNMQATVFLHGGGGDSPTTLCQFAWFFWRWRSISSLPYAALTSGLVSFLVFPDLASAAMKSQTSVIALTGGGSGDCCSFLEILPCFMMKNRLSSKSFFRIAHN